MSDYPQCNGARYKVACLRDARREESEREEGRYGRDRDRRDRRHDRSGSGLGPAERREIRERMREQYGYEEGGERADDLIRQIEGGGGSRNYRQGRYRHDRDEGINIERLFEDLLRGDIRIEFGERNHDRRHDDDNVFEKIKADGELSLNELRYVLSAKNENGQYYIGPKTLRKLAEDVQRDDRLDERDSIRLLGQLSPNTNRAHVAASNLILDEFDRRGNR